MGKEGCFEREEEIDAVDAVDAVEDGRGGGGCSSRMVLIRELFDGLSNSDEKEDIREEEENRSWDEVEG